MYYGFTSSEKDLKLFFEGRAKRMLQCIDFAPTVVGHEAKFKREIGSLNSDGFVILRNVFPRAELEAIGQVLNTCVQKTKLLAPIRDHAMETTNDLMQGKFKYVDMNAVVEGHVSIRDKVSSVGIQDPLINVPAIMKVVFDKHLVGLATAYFQTAPMLTFAKLRKTFVNDLPITDTQRFHADGGSYRIFKAIIYLNDVAAGEGPFCYVRGSHQKKFDGWETHSRYTHDDMSSIYGEENVVSCCADAGDVVLAETTGFHCGKKPTISDRGALIVTYCVQPEYGFDYPKVKIMASSVEQLSVFERLVADPSSVDII